MKKILKNVFVGILSLVAVLAVIGFFLPSKWKVERSLVIGAQPQAIYPMIANLKEGWPQWSAFDHQDPDAQYTYNGPTEGVGASRTWISKMGDGTQTIVKASPESGVVYTLEMPSYNTSLEGIISFEPQGNLTKVTWTDDGDFGFNIAKRYMGLLMDKMLGKTMEDSLITLKAKAEKH